MVCGWSRSRWMKLRSWVLGSATVPTADQVVELFDDDPAQLLAEVVVVGRRGRTLAAFRFAGGSAGTLAGVGRGRVRRHRARGGAPRREPGEVAHGHRRIGVVGQPDPVDQVVRPEVL